MNRWRRVGGLSVALVAVVTCYAAVPHFRTSIKRAAPRRIRRAGHKGAPVKQLSSPEKRGHRAGMFIETPPGTRVLSGSSIVAGRARQSTLKLESLLSPVELQIFYTDLMVKDWMIARDDLTEGVGWSGVFMKLEPKESIGVFAVVKTIGSPSSRSNPTAISIIKVEEL